MPNHRLRGVIPQQPGTHRLGSCLMTRYGMVIRIKTGCEEEYRRHLAAVWPEVLETIRKCSITNYSIPLKNNLLFSYFENHGSDFKADMVKHGR